MLAFLHHNTTSPDGHALSRDTLFSLIFLFLIRADPGPALWARRPYLFHVVQSNTLALAAYALFISGVWGARHMAWIPVPWLFGLLVFFVHVSRFGMSFDIWLGLVQILAFWWLSSFPPFA